MTEGAMGEEAAGDMNFFTNLALSGNGPLSPELCICTEGPFLCAIFSSVSF